MLLIKKKYLYVISFELNRRKSNWSICWILTSCAWNHVGLCDQCLCPLLAKHHTQAGQGGQEEL